MEPTSAIETVFREERGRVLATLIRVLGDFDLAEDALAAAWEAAVRQWPRDGRPDNPRAWLIRAARNKAIDDLRRQTLATRAQDQLQAEAPAATEPETDDPRDPDDRLRLMFTCCHPALAVEAQVALTLRTLAGLSTEEIARAFLVPAVTMAQRLVRAKQKIRGAGIPYRVPDEDELPERVDAVMAVVYLVFNEGYAATSGDDLVRRDLATEAIRLGRLLVELMPTRPSPRGLLALMLLHDSRRDARVTPDGDLVLLEEQDRARWDRAQIREGLALVEAALRDDAVDAYALQAAIAAVHASAARPGDTDWPQIVALYARLFAEQPSPVVMLNHAVAVAMSAGPIEGLRLLDQLVASGLLVGYHWLPAARADLLRRLGRKTDAAAAYAEALALAGNEAERRFLRRRLAELEA
ncbi:MAG TPA: sigma-70 family RNA polymerase sigma factor [Polyangia bacterium]|jgi:RNA polymerase sigma-70 factor (ECF subfamily)|nr:sigma-70 family RNA polymerase sigma factor [Polyangia bacterium]